MRSTRLLTFAASALLLAGCNSGDTHIGGAIVVAGDKAVISAAGRPNATISADGELDIGGTRVAVTADQRQLLRHYYEDATQVRTHGLAAGKAGAMTGVHALTGSIAGLFDGKSKEQTKAEVEASTQQVIAAASRICHDLARIQSTQDALASQLPAFRPYARLKDNDVSECQDDMERARDSVKRAQAQAAAKNG
jgi:hypothetical protein